MEEFEGRVEEMGRRRLCLCSTMHRPRRAGNRDERLDLLLSMVDVLWRHPVEILLPPDKTFPCMYICLEVLPLSS